MNGNLESLGRVKLQALLTLAVVFAMGVLVGIAVDWAVAPRPPQPPREGPRGLPPDMAERLDLTPEQSRRIEELMTANRARVDAVLDQYLPQLRALTDSVRTEVRAVLTPEQQEIFDAMGKDRGDGPPGAHRPGPGDRKPPPDDGKRPPPPR